MEGGGKNGPAQSFPTLFLLEICQSLVQIQCKSSLNQGLTDKLKG